MSKKDKQGRHNNMQTVADLRKWAEKAVKKRFGNAEPSSLSAEDARRLLQELQVHQIELEMQNEELRRSQQMLEESRERFSDLYDFAPVGYLTLDKDGTILEANLTGATLLGVQRARLINKPFTGFVSRDFQDAFYIYGKNVLKSEGRQSIELKIKRKGGPVFDAKCESIMAEGGTIRMVLSDITDQKQVEVDLESYRKNLEHMVEERTAELMKLNSELGKEIVNRKKMEEEVAKSQKLESLGVLAGGIAHDFNNSLAAILNNISATEMILKKEKSNGRALEMLQFAAKAVQRATAMTYQLLTFARGGEPVRKTVYIKNLIMDTVDISLRGSRAGYIQHIAEDLWPANVDEGQIAQVISNLVINAAQAMSGGGNIHISADNLRIKKGDAVHLKPGKYVRLTVRDDGPGIDEKDLARIFDPYFTTKKKGSGLGLATAYSIMRKHDGLVTAESKPGKGTVFTVYLPASKDEVMQVEETEEREFIGGKILVMDDEEDVRDSVQTMLTVQGYEVDFAREGGEAVKAYRDAMNSGRRYDAVVMDLTVRGGMGGEEALKKIRELDLGVKAVVTSGYSNDPVMADFERYGFIAALSKPYDITDLNSILRKVIVDERRS